MGCWKGIGGQGDKENNILFFLPIPLFPRKQNLLIYKLLDISRVIGRDVAVLRLYKGLGQRIIKLDRCL
jgi:hypothetical protein